MQGKPAARPKSLFRAATIASTIEPAAALYTKRPQKLNKTVRPRASRGHQALIEPLLSLISPY
eukprot:1196313-Prorocentrum_minimum.AAC.8